MTRLSYADLQWIIGGWDYLLEMREITRAEHRQAVRFIRYINSYAHILSDENPTRAAL